VTNISHSTYIFSSGENWKGLFFSLSLLQTQFPSGANTHLPA